MPFCHRKPSYRWIKWIQTHHLLLGTNSVPFSEMHPKDESTNAGWSDGIDGDGTSADDVDNNVVVEMSVAMIWWVSADEVIWGAAEVTFLKTLQCFWVGLPLWGSSTSCCNKSSSPSASVAMTTSWTCLKPSFFNSAACTSSSTASSKIYNP